MSPDDQVAEIRKRHTHSPQFPCRTCFLLDRLAEVTKERDEARAKYVIRYQQNSNLLVDTFHDREDG